MPDVIEVGVSAKARICDDASCNEPRHTAKLSSCIDGFVRKRTEATTGVKPSLSIIAEYYKDTENLWAWAIYRDRPAIAVLRSVPIFSHPEIALSVGIQTYVKLFANMHELAVVTIDYEAKYFGVTSG